MLAVVCCFFVAVSVFGLLFCVCLVLLVGVLASLAFANIAVWSGCEVNLSDTMDFA